MIALSDEKSPGEPLAGWFAPSGMNEICGNLPAVMERVSDQYRIYD